MAQLAVAGLLRRDERVYAQRKARRLPEPSRRRHRRILPWGLANVVDGLLHHRRSLALWLEADPHDHLVNAVHHRLTNLPLQKVLSSRCGMMRDSASVKFWALTSSTPGIYTFGSAMFASRLRLGFQRRHGFPYLLQPTLSKVQLLRQTHLVFAVPRSTESSAAWACCSNSATSAGNCASLSFMVRVTHRPV